MFAAIKKDWLNSLGFLFLSIMLFAGGYYFGVKSSLSQSSSNSSSQTLQAESKTSDLPNSSGSNIVAKEVPGAFWIKNGQDPTCPAEYPIKGKFDSSANIFYTKENKMYTRIKPHICFVNEDFAEKEAGFLKKY